MSALPIIEDVCVIGAGVSGLTAIKHLKEYNINVICFEKGNHIGGLWKYNEGDRKGYGSVMRNTILNTSKEFVTFSDFPMDSNRPNFMPNHMILDYFHQYSKHFKLEESIKYNTEVIKVMKSADYEDTGAWDVTVKCNDIINTRRFSAVIVCNGHHVFPFTPNIKGIRQFKGKISHSHDYSNHLSFIDRRVLIIGLGNSGGDIACELARIASKVYCSCRNGSWVTRRVVNEGYPRDVILRTRHYERIMSYMPKFLKKFLSLRDANNFVNHDLYGLKPAGIPGQSPVLLADDLPLHLASGFVQIRSGISHFSESSVHYYDGISDEIDDVIFCTGYDFDFNFIEDGNAIPVSDNQTELWKRTFSPHLKWNSLACVGVVDPLGPTMTLCEMQSRVISHIWANKINLPSKKKMMDEIFAEKRATAARFLCSARRSSLQCDYVPLMDQLAQLIDVYPPLQLSLFIKDPKLAFMLHFGPVVAAQYRLSGPNSKPIARKIVTECLDRVHHGMNPRRKDKVNFLTTAALLIFNVPTKIIFILLSSFILFVILFIID